MALAPISVSFDQALTDAVAAIFGVTSGDPYPSADYGTAKLSAFRLGVPVGCVSDVTTVSTQTSVNLFGLAPGDVSSGDGVAVVIFAWDGTSPAPYDATPVISLGDDLSALQPGFGLVGHWYTASGGGTVPGSVPTTLDAAWSGSLAPGSEAILVVVVDMQASGPGGTLSASPPTALVEFAPGSACAGVALEPVPVDDTPVGTIGVTSTGDASLNDDNTGCVPGCAVYRAAAVFVDPASTAGGAAGTVDTAGVWTADATSAGTVVLNIESGCSPSCDPSGADVDPAGWVPQTLTVTFSEPAGPCETVNAIYDPGASAFFAGFFTGFFAGTAGGPGGPTGQGSQGPTISVYQVDAPSVCVATIASVQVQSTVTASPGFDPTNDLLAVAVFSDLSTFTIWGTPTAVSGQANITFPGSVSSGYTSGGGTLVPLIDATWSGGPATSPIYVVVVADASESAPGESIAGSAPILCVEFGDPDCPPASNPKPSDVVKLCVAAAPQAGCATFGGTPSPTLFVAVSGPDGNVIPANSTSYPSNSVGGSDGSGYIRSYYTTTSGLVVTPDAGTWTPGSCGADARQLPAGAVSIADGVYAATLGPNGSNWFPPAGLKSVTVYARHAATNDDATAGGSPGRVEVFVNSNVFMLLDGESFTWSVDDPDSLTTISEVRCEADAAAAIVWVAG